MTVGILRRQSARPSTHSPLDVLGDFHPRLDVDLTGGGILTAATASLNRRTDRSASRHAPVRAVWIDVGGPSSTPGRDASSPPLFIQLTDQPGVPLLPVDVEAAQRALHTSLAVVMVPVPSGAPRPGLVDPECSEEISEISVEVLVLPHEGDVLAVLELTPETTDPPDDVVADGGAIRVSLALGGEAPRDRRVATEGVGVAPADAVRSWSGKREVGDDERPADLVALAQGRSAGPADGEETEEEISGLVPVGLPEGTDDWLDGLGDLVDDPESDR